MVSMTTSCGRGLLEQTLHTNIVQNMYIWTFVIYKYFIRTCYELLLITPCR